MILQAPTGSDGQASVRPVDKKNVLAKEIHRLLDLPLDNKNPKLGRKIINTIFRTIKEALLRGEEVFINGFGTFKLRTPRPRVRNGLILTSYGRGRPKDVVFIPTRYTPHTQVIFQPSAALMAMINLPNGRTTPTYKERRTQRCWGVTHEN